MVLVPSLFVKRFMRREKEEVDAKHLLFFYELGGCESVLFGLKWLALWMVVIRWFTKEDGNDAIFFAIEILL